MHDSGKQLLELMFKEGETICVSPNQFAYLSVPLRYAMNGKLTLVPNEDNKPFCYPDSNELLLVALNPIKGNREDLNCTAYRNFLIEIDTGSLQEQMAYIEKLRMPFSAAIFSGNKSLHFLIALKDSLPSEKVYRHFAEWILNIVTLADQNTKNPSRSIRIPGAFREPGKQQQLYAGDVKFIELNTLVDWLKLHPNAKPKEREKRIISDKPDFKGIKRWVLKSLYEGVKPPNRNKQWFTIAVEFALTGYEEDYTINLLSQYFSPENDFKEREWETAIRSGFKYAYERKK